PAIDAGNPAVQGSEPTACAVLAQNGVFRPKDGDNNGTAVCDIGAFESAAVGGFDLFPNEATVQVDDVIFSSFKWTHTRNWHDLETLQLRIVIEADDDTILWVLRDQ